MTDPNPLRPAPGAPRPYHFPNFIHRPLDSGLTLWVVPLPDRDMVSVHLLVDGGAASESEAEGGIAALTAESLVTGTQRLDGHAFAEASERLGIELFADSSWDVARAGFVALPAQWTAGLALLAEMVREPGFDEGEFDRIREERLADILQARSEPGRLADEFFLRHVFGEGAPVRPAVGRHARDGRTAGRVPGARPPRAELAPGSVPPGRGRTGGRGRGRERGPGRSFGDWAGTSPGHRSIDGLRPRRAAGGHRRSARIGPERAAHRSRRDRPPPSGLLSGHGHGRLAGRDVQQPPEPASARGAGLHLRGARGLRPAPLGGPLLGPGRGPDRGHRRRHPRDAAPAGGHAVGAARRPRSCAK